MLKELTRIFIMIKSLHNKKSNFIKMNI